MVSAFASRLNHRLAGLSLPPGVLQQVHTGENKLAGLRVPAGLNPRTQATIEESIGRAFVFGFRIILLICAGLSVGSAAVAWRMIREDKPKLHGQTHGRDRPKLAGEWRQSKSMWRDSA